MTEVIYGKRKTVLLKNNFFYEVVKNKDDFWFKKIEPLNQTASFESYSFLVNALVCQQKVFVIKKSSDGSRSIIINNIYNDVHKISLLDNCIILTPSYEKGFYTHMVLHDSHIFDENGKELKHNLPPLHVISPMWEVYPSHLKISTMGGTTHYFMRMQNHFLEVEKAPKEKEIPYGYQTKEQLALTAKELELLKS